jgi:circadian clock protein KaiC
MEAVPEKYPSHASIGISGLDSILSGGLQRQRFYLIEGMPGSGKTTLALQFLLEGAKRGEKCLYVTLSETEHELRNTATSHGWSLDAITILEVMPLEASADQQQALIHPSEVELDHTVNLIIDQVRKLNPDRLVIDALTELRLLALDSLSYRRQILALRQFFDKSKCTVLALDDLTEAAPGLHLHSMVHGIVNLEQRLMEYGTSRRRLSVLKLRGVKYQSGFHDYVIRTGGIVVFPSLIAADHEGVRLRDSMSSGIAPLDALLGGGLRRGTSTLLIGPSGVGKSSLALHYAMAAALRGQRAAVFAFDESFRTAAERAAGLGMDLEHTTRQGLLTWKRISPTTISPGEFVDAVQHEVDAGAGIIVIDSLNSYISSMPGETALILHAHELLAYLGNKGVATVLIMAQHGLVGDTQAPLDLSFLADAIVMLRYFEADGEVRKAISVLKSRGGMHETTIREFRLAPKEGVQVGPPIRAFQGVLAGTPSYVGEPGSLPNVRNGTSAQR